MPKYDLTIAGKIYEVDAPDEESLPDIADEIASREQGEPVRPSLPDALPTEEKAQADSLATPAMPPASIKPDPSLEFENTMKSKAQAAQDQIAQADAQAQTAKAQAEDPANWTAEKTKQYWKANPPRNPQEAAQAQAAIKIKTEQEKALARGITAPILTAGEKPKETGLRDQLKTLFTKGPVALGSDFAREFMTKTPEDQRGEAWHKYAISQAADIPLSIVDKEYRNIRELPEITGVERDMDTKDMLAAGMTIGMAGGAIAAPLTMMAGIAIFKAADELENAAISKIKQKPYVFGSGENIASLLPDEANETTRDIFDIVDLAAKGAIVGGVFKAAPRLSAKLTKDIITKYKLPEKIYISPEKIISIFQAGDKILPEEVDLVKSLGLNAKQYRDAISRGVSIEVPMEKIVTIKDKPYWGKIKEAFNVKPFEETRTLTAGDPRTSVRGLIEKKAEMPQDVKTYEIKSPTIDEQPKAGGMIHDDLISKIKGLSDNLYKDNKLQKVKLGRVLEKEISVLKKESKIDATDFHHEIDNYALQHALNQHGQDPNPITSDDFLKIPEILQAPDEVKYLGSNRRDQGLLRYEKKYNGLTYYVEETRTGKKTLSMVSMYKTETPKSAKYDQRDLTSLRPPFQEAPTPSSVNVSIPQEAGGVKGSEKIQIFRIDEPIDIANTQGEKITLPKGEEYRAYNLGGGKIRLQDGKQITIYEGELSKLKGHMLKEGEQPRAGGKIHEKKTLTGEILARGGLDPNKLQRAGYNVNESFVQSNLKHILKKGGQGLDDIADQFVSEGLMQVPGDKNPGDYLLELLQSKEGRKISTGEPTKKELEEGIAQVEKKAALEKEQGIEFNPEEYEREGKIRKFIITVKEAEKTAPEVKERVDGRYTPITNQDTLVEAQKFVLDNYNEALRSAMSNDTPTAFSNATAQVLIDKAQGEGRWEEARQIIEKTAERNTSLGQAIQALAMYERLTPEGILRYADSVIKKAREDRSKPQLKQFLEAIKGKKDPAEIADLAKKMKMPYLDEVTMKDLYDHAKRIETMEPGREKSIETALLLKKIANKIPKSDWVKVSMIQTISQLLNPKTIIRNLLGNMGFLVAENISDTFGTVLDMAVSLKTGKRTKYIPDLKLQYRGFTKGFKEGYEEAMLGIDLSGQTTKYSLPRNGVFDEGVLGALEKTMLTTLKAPDRAFYQAAFNQSLENQMRAAGVKDPTPNMIEQAHLDGLYRTFQDDNALSRAFVGLKKILNINGEWGIGDAIIKYPKTPANILARGIEYSPFGIVQALYRYGKSRIRKEGFNQRRFVEDLSRGTTGLTLLVGMGAFLAGLGIITGKSDKDKDVRDLKKQVGLGEHRINISALKRFIMSGLNEEAAKRRKEDTLISYDWFQPAAINMAMGANIYETARQGKKSVVDHILGQSNSLAEGMASAAQTIVEQPLMQGVKALTSKEDIIQSISDIGKNIPASFVPTLLNQVRQFTDNISRNTKDPNYLKEAVNKVMNKIPGASYALPPNITTFGKKQELYKGGTNNPFNVFLNPAFVSKYQPTKEAKMVLGIWERTGETKQFPRVAKNEVVIEGRKIPLYGSRYMNYQKYIGNKTGVLYQILANDPAFMASPDEEKAKKLSKYLTDINTAAKIEILGYRPDRVNADVITIIRDLAKFYKPKK